jgi:hypothetical protein
VNSKDERMTKGSKSRPKPEHGKVAEVLSTRTCETRLALPTGVPDIPALTSITREWLVPRLVQEFLRERQGVDLPRPRKKT